MKNQIDLAKLVNEIEDYDLDSIKEELKCYGEITLQIGYFEYDEEFLGEPCFVFDDENTVDDLEDDEYYDRYKSEDAGYGISLDKDLNVVYGYFISETFHDFKDARDDDEVKNEIYSLLDEADIWKTSDESIINSIYDFYDKIDLEKVVKWIDDPFLSNSVAFDNNKSVGVINKNLDSIKEALNNHDKIFLEIGYFGYDDETNPEEPYFIFDGEDIIDDWKDNKYYDKYKFLVAGYGIYLDKDLNVEYGYYTTEAPSSGHGMGYTTYHDFKDTRDDDEIKSEIYSLLDGSNIWESDDVEIVVKEEKENEIIKSTFIEGSCPKCGQKVIKDTKNQVAIKCSECGYTFWL